ncbi:MAG: sigma-70 family RNA polymerase sigma factor [Lachnospiraceae bacterium]|nr:sigma-70 family RNA polymerase sigma factor [Lachnospiraceae bacterium]
MTKEEALQQAIMELREGKESGFNTIYSHTYNYVFQRARLLMKSEEEAQDVVQEVYIAVYQSLHTLEDPSKLYAWMGGITYNLAMRAYRKKKEVLLDEEKDGIFETIELQDMDFKPEEKAQSEATAVIIKEIIDGLPELQKAAVFAFYYDGMSVKDIAGRFNVSENTIKSRLNYARKYLKDAVEEKEKKEGYRLHSFGLPTLLLAFFLWGKDKAVTATQAQGVYNEICNRLGLQPTDLHPVEQGGRLQQDGNIQSIRENPVKENNNDIAKTAETESSGETAESAMASSAATSISEAAGVSAGMKIAIGIVVAALGIGAAGAAVHTINQANPVIGEESQPENSKDDMVAGDWHSEMEVTEEVWTETEIVENKDQIETKNSNTEQSGEAERQKEQADTENTGQESDNTVEQTVLPENSPILNPDLVSQEAPSYTIETVTYESAQGTFIYPQIRGWDNTKMQDYWNEQWRMDGTKVTEEDLEANYEVKTANPNYLSIVTRSSFMGGMHPYATETAYNIDMRTGQMIPVEHAVDISKCAALLQDDSLYRCNNEAVNAQYVIDYYSYSYEETDDTNMKLEKILRESVLKEYENVNSSSWYISNGQLSLIVWVTHADGDFVDVTFAP